MVIQAQHLHAGGDIRFTQQIIQQYEEKKRKTWRKLATLTYPIEEEHFEADLNIRFPAQIIYALRRTFRGQHYVSFTALMHIGQQEMGPEKSLGVKLLTHRVDLIGTMKSTLAQLWNPSNPDRERFQNEINNELIELQREFVVSHRILDKQDAVFAYQFIYDEPGKRISIAPYEQLSVSPSEYPERLRSTSEILQLLCAIPHVNFFHMDLDEARQFYPLMKLYIPLLEHQAPSFDLLRINTENYEDWDYVNPELDQQMESARHPSR